MYGGKYYMDFIENLVLFPAVKKKFENPLRIEKVIAMSLVYYFFGTQCMWPSKFIVVHSQETVQHKNMFFWANENSSKKLKHVFL